MCRLRTRLVRKAILQGKRFQVNQSVTNWERSAPAPAFAELEPVEYDFGVRLWPLNQTCLAFFRIYPTYGRRRD